jgi:opacity protein-like surface antigen
LSDDFGYQRYDAVTTGYVLGGGLEYRFSPSWSIKTEYQYLNFAVLCSSRHQRDIVAGQL